MSENIIEELKQIEKSNISKLKKKQETIYNDLVHLKDDYEEKLKNSQFEFEKKKQEEIQNLKNKLSSKKTDANTSVLDKKFEKNKNLAKEEAIKILFK